MMKRGDKAIMQEIMITECSLLVPINESATVTNINKSGIQFRIISIIDAIDIIIIVSKKIYSLFIR